MTDIVATITTVIINQLPVAMAWIAWFSDYWRVR